MAHAPENASGADALTWLDDDLVAEIRALFVEEAPRHVAALHRSIAAADSAAMAASAHRLAGDAGAAGWPRIEALARQLLAVGRDGTTSGTTDVMSSLEAAVAQAAA